MKKYRALRKFSQEKLAEKAGASANYIAMIESGKNFPSLPMLSQIACALEIDELDLFDREGLVYLPMKNLEQNLTEQIVCVIKNCFANL